MLLSLFYSPYMFHSFTQSSFDIKFVNFLLKLVDKMDLSCATNEQIKIFFFF